MPVTKAQAKRLLDPDWVRAADMPHMAARYAETYIKRRVMVAEDAAVVELAQLYRDTWQAMRRDADDLPVAGRASGQWADMARRRIEAMRAPMLEIAIRGILQAWYLGFMGRAWLLDSTIITPVAARPPAFERIVADTERLMQEDVYTDLIRTIPNTGVLWQRYGNELDDALVRVRTAIFTGMNAGESTDQIMRRVRDVLGLDVDWMHYRRGQATILQGTWSNFNRVQTITRTVVNKASNDGAIEIFRQNENVLVGYRWLAARDERVCPTCRGLNGTLYGLNEQYRPPAHPNCRCTIIPEINPALLAGAGILDAPPEQSFEEWAAAAGLLYLLNTFTAPRKLDSPRIGALPDEAGEWG
jgi:SPP1 gp7 family putative phage head morphogenesis protein